MSVKRGLGKGLDSMIPEKLLVGKNTDNSGQDVSRETFININDIEPNREQPRRYFEEDALQELADSIKQYGVIQPLILQKKGKLYYIVAGERRWRAAKLAGLKKVPALIKDYTDQEVLEVALIENIQREDLNPIEEALAYQNLIKEYGLTQDQLAEKLGKSRTAITNSSRLLKLNPKVQQMLIDGMISEGHGRALLQIIDADMQYEVAQHIFDQKLSVREVEKLAKKLQSGEKPPKEVTENSKDDVIYHDIEDRIREIMGTKVVIHKQVKDKGKIEIEYYSKDELERLIELFESIG